MASKGINNQISFIELYSTDLARTKEFYSNVFGWSFVDYGDQYCDIKGAGVRGGFAKVDAVTTGGALVVLYHEDLEVVIEAVLENGGKISQETFEFPGGKRFQFIDPNGNELAVWSDK